MSPSVIESKNADPPRVQPPIHLGEGFLTVIMLVKCCQSEDGHRRLQNLDVEGRSWFGGVHALHPSPPAMKRHVEKVQIGDL
jgi:hypothetical protein